MNFLSQRAWGRQVPESDLASAIEPGQLFLVRQTTIDLQTNAFAGVETHPLTSS